MVTVYARHKKRANELGSDAGVVSEVCCVRVRTERTVLPIA